MCKNANEVADKYVNSSGIWNPSKPSLIIKKLSDNQKIIRNILTKSFVDFLIEKYTAIKEINKKK